MVHLTSQSELPKYLLPVFREISRFFSVAWLSRLQFLVLALAYLLLKCVVHELLVSYFSFRLSLKRKNTPQNRPHWCASPKQEVLDELAEMN